MSVLPAWPVWAALLWVAGEALRSVFPFGGFPWGNIAFTQPEGVYLPLAAVGGTPLIAFAVTLTGFGLTALARTLLAANRGARRCSRRRSPCVLPVAAAFGALPLVGTDANDGEATVAVVQGNVPRAGPGLQRPAPGRARQPRRAHRRARRATSPPVASRSRTW